MKRILTTVVICICCMGCFETKTKIIETGFEGELMPPMNLLLMDSATLINTKTIANRKPTVIYYFSPQCPYCKVQTKEIIDNLKSLTNVNIYMLSSFPFSMIKGYYKSYDLENYSNLIVGQDVNGDFDNHYKVPGVPYIAVYDDNKNLRKVFLGNIKAEYIKEAVFN